MNQMSVLLFTENITPRLKYITGLLFEEIIGVGCSHTSSVQDFTDYEGVKISYGKPGLGKGIFIPSVALLSESGLSPILPEVEDYQGVPALFPSRDPDATLPFDVFAAAFYMVSRYEEYLPHTKDQHGRFPAGASLADLHGFTRIPVVNLWARQLALALKAAYPSFIIPAGEYKFVPTYDIDIAFAYRSRGLIRTTGGILRSLAGLDLPSVSERVAVLAGGRQDPYDTFAWQLEKQQEYGLEPVYFILLGKYGPYDKNISPANRSFRELLQKISGYAEVGIHPSYGSFGNTQALKDEVRLLSKITGKEVISSRHHYLRIDIPETYRSLVEIGICNDYSMGYAETTGFRAGICTPYHFYDLGQERETSLRVHPFALMDGTLKDYMKLNNGDAWNMMKEMVDAVRQVDGTFIPLWHNETLSDRGRWQGWRELYEEMVRYAMKSSV